MSIFAQFKYNGLLYTLKVQPTKEFPSNEVPFDKQLTEQFKDIAQNHAALAVEEADRPNVYGWHRNRWTSTTGNVGND